MATHIKIYCNILIFKLIIGITVLFICSSAVSAQDSTELFQTQQLYDRARYHNRTGNHDYAIQLLHTAVKIKQETHEDAPPEYFKIYNQLGVVYKREGNLDKAIEYYMKALKNTENEFNQSVINGNIANVYSFKGDYLKANDYFENALHSLQFSNSASKHLRIAENFHNQGFNYDKLGKYQLAKEYYLKSIQIAQNHNILDIGDTYYNCGIIYKKLDSLSLAKEFLLKSLSINTKNFGKKHIKTTLSLMYLADFYVEINNFEDAKKIYEQVFQNLSNTVGPKHLYTSYYYKQLGDMYGKMGKYHQALKNYQYSLISKVENFNNADILINPSVSIIPDIDLLEILKRKANCLTTLSKIENREVNLKAALSALELSVKFIEQLRMGYLYEDSKLILAEKEHETYTDIMKIAYQLLEITGNNDYANIAFKYSERSKYAILREIINEESARNVASIPDSVQNGIQKIKEQIGFTRLQIEKENELVKQDSLKQTGLKEKLFRLTQAQEKLIKELEQNYPRYYKRKYENQVVGINELRLQLSEKEAVISYELADSNLYTFLVTHKARLFNRIKLDSAFFEHFEIYQEFLHSRSELGYVKFRIASYELYKTLIKPIENQLKGKNLLIVPDSKMSLIAFESLITEPYQKKQFADYATEPYLLVKYPIGYTYSATLYFNSLQKKKRWNPKFLGFAPNYISSRDSLDPMPLAIKNIKGISRIMRGKVFTGEDAIECNLKRNYKNYGILHLYAHGNEDLENPQFSKIYLSYRNDTIEDGYLHAYEIDELDIDADLVVLASCYSGSGTINKSEGALSIGRRFLNAGNASLMISLWTATYEPTLFELKEFYKHLVLGKRKDESLRLAKLKYLKSANPLEANPRYWASLIIVGNQDALFRGYILSKIFLVLIVTALAYAILRVRKKRKKAN